MDLALVDKLASQNNGVKYLLVAVVIFSRFVRVKTMKTKYAKGILQAFRKMISRKKTIPKNFRLIKKQNMGELLKVKDIEVYSTMSKTKAEERAIQSLKHIIHHYIEDHGEKFVPKLQQFVSTLNCRKSINWKISQRCENSDFYQFCITNRSRNILNQNLKLVIELEFRKMIFRSEKDKSHNLHMKFLKFHQYLQKTFYIHHQRSRIRRNPGKI